MGIRENSMIIDVHTHISKSQHYSRETMEESLFAKDRNLNTEELKELFNIDLKKYIKTMSDSGVNKSVVLAIDITRVTPTKVPNRYVYDFVKNYPDRLIGFSSVQPLDFRGRFREESLKEFTKSVFNYGFKGLKLLPTYSRYYPHDKALYPLYQKADELKVPVLFHLSATSHVFAGLKYSNPLFIEDVAWDFPNLKICISHMGYPWTEELLVVMRKHRNVYTDISALFGRPTILTWNMVMAKEYGVLHKVMFGTDYPVINPKDFIEWCKNKLNENARRMGLPTFTSEEIKGLLGRNAEKYLGL